MNVCIIWGTNYRKARRVNMYFRSKFNWIFFLEGVDMQ